MRDLSTDSLKGRFIVELVSQSNNTSLWHPILEVGKELLCVNGDWDKANRSFEQALQLADDLTIHSSSAVLVKASALICTGATCLCIGKRDQAAEYFRRGERLYVDKNERYGQAVVSFALALIYESGENWRDVFKCYEHCQSLLTDTGLTASSSVKYLLAEVSDRRKAAIYEWRRKSIGDDGTKVGPAIPKASPIPFEFLPIFSQIPAGDPRPIPKHVTGYIETDHIIIDGQYYMVKGKNHRVRLPFSPDISYIVLKVDGDSMDNAGIDNGDYVILRTRPIGLLLAPEDREIVAVAFPGVTEEPFVTLKRYKKNPKGGYHFEPDSSNPTHKSYHFGVTDSSSNPTHKSYHFGVADSIPPRIIGILVAVLKPL